MQQLLRCANDGKGAGLDPYSEALLSHSTHHYSLFADREWLQGGGGRRRGREGIQLFQLDGNHGNRMKTAARETIPELI